MKDYGSAQDAQNRWISLNLIHIIQLIAVSAKIKLICKIRKLVIEDNPELYKKYCESKGVKIILHTERSESKLAEMPLTWYKNQLENYRKPVWNFTNTLPANI